MGEKDIVVNKQKVIENIKTNYSQIERSIVEQLYMKHDLHGTTMGSAREDIWRQLFEMIIPKKFVIEQSVFIIDSKDGISHEVDLVIFDETYTPYIFQYGKLKFIPIEAVAAVVECKSRNVGTTIDNWSKSIESLRTSGESIARMAGSIATGSVPTQKSTRPIRILCSMENNVQDKIKEKFDFTLLAIKNGKNNQKTPCIKIDTNKSKKDNNLFTWYKELNFHEEKFNNGDDKVKQKLEKISLDDYVVKNEEDTSISLLSFNFQLNQLLMLINNPILFPHRSYVDMFNLKKGVMSDV